MRLRNLKIWQKLALIVTVMGIPTITLAYLLVGSSNVQVSAAKEELSGLKYIDVVRRVFEHVPQHRAAAAAVVSGDTELRSVRAALVPVIDRDIAALEDIDARLGKEWGSAAKVTSIKSRWARIRTNVDTFTAAESASEHKALNGEILELIRHVADKSQLILDSELDTYYLMSSMVIEIPQAVEALHETRGLGITAAVGKRVTEGVRAQLGALSSTVQGRVADLKRSIGVAASVTPALAQLNAPA